MARLYTWMSGRKVHGKKGGRGREGRREGGRCGVFQHRPKIIMADSEHMVTTLTRMRNIYICDNTFSTSHSSLLNPHQSIWRLAVPWRVACCREILDSGFDSFWSRGTSNICGLWK